jgi:phage baseplate assembly protein W
MSFDVRAFNGDVELGQNGDFMTVTDSDKLAQDIIKLLNTPIGTNPLNPGYGSTLTVNQIGTSILSAADLIDQTKTTITQALEQLISQQNAQSAIQPLTDAETLVDFETPIVEQDPQEPRRFNIAVNAISRGLTPLTIALVVRF